VDTAALKDRRHPIADYSRASLHRIAGDIVELEGSPWLGCTRTMLKDA
jgi:glutamine synthetase